MLIQGSQPVRRIQGVAGTKYCRVEATLSERASRTGRSHDRRSVCRSSAITRASRSWASSCGARCTWTWASIIRRACSTKHSTSRVFPASETKCRLKKPRWPYPGLVFQALSLLQTICLTMCSPSCTLLKPAPHNLPLILHIFTLNLFAVFFIVEG